MDQAKSKKPAQGVQSVEIGFRVLDALIELDRSAPLRDIARRAGMSTSGTHRYLASLMRVGLVVQDAASGEYDLGTKALQIGLSALSRIDNFKLASEALEELHAKTAQTVALLVWGNRGATIVRWKEAIRAVTVNARAGYVLPTTASASGRLFAAFLPEDVVSASIDQEFASGLRPQYMGQLLDPVAFQQLMDEIRTSFISITKGDLLPGVNALSAPVFNHENSLVFAISIWGGEGFLDFGPGESTYQLLKAATCKLSRDLGYKKKYPIATKKLMAKRMQADS
jgi:DNA-binding IclR family transcriptional regulator